MSSPTLENLVETAYRDVLRLYETDLVDVRINLASAATDQTTTAADDNSGRDPATIPIPCVRLRAEAVNEAVGMTTPKWAVRLEVEVEQLGTVADGGITLDELYRLAVRPFWYSSPTLAEALATANASLRVHGVSKRGEGLEQEAMEASISRRNFVTIHCAPATIA